MPPKIRVGIIFGGKSSEHEVSLASAASIISAINKDKYEIVPLGITKQGRWVLGEGAHGLIPEEVIEKGRPILIPHDPEVQHLLPLALSDREPNESALQSSASSERGASKVDVVFPVLHGRFGEDGTIQGLLELAGIPYVGAGVLGSSVGMDKDVMKRLFREAGLPVAPFLTLTSEELTKQRNACKRKISRLIHFPCFVKPSNSGSSVGIHKVHDSSELDSAIDDALQYDEKILAEKGIEGRELECSVLGNENPIASLPGEVVPSREFYDYEDKYIDDAAQLIIPARVTRAQTRKIQELALAAFRTVSASGMARVDFFLEDKTGKVLLNEINTSPGFTKISMYPKLWEASGISYSELIDRLIQLALDRHAHRSQLKCSYQPPH